MKSRHHTRCPARRPCAARAPLAAALLLAAAGPCLGQWTERISTSSAEVQGSVASGGGSITPNGRWVVFYSLANTLVPNDNNPAADVFVKDRWTGQTVRVSVPDPTTGQTNANAACICVAGVRAISDDGRYVVFSTIASNLITNDTNNVIDIYVRDRDADADGIFDEAGLGNTRTTRVNLTPTDLPAPGCGSPPCPFDSAGGCMSADGRFVAWSSSYDFTGTPVASVNIYVRDRDPDADGIMDETNATTILASPSCPGCTHDGASSSPTLSADGRYVAFLSYSNYIVPGDLNPSRDVFVRDLAGNQTWCVSVSSSEIQCEPGRDASAVSISDSGRWVAFASPGHYGGGPSGIGPDSMDVGGIYVRDLDPDADGLFEELLPPNNNPGFPPTEGVTELASFGYFYTIGQLFWYTWLNGHSFYPVISGDGRYVAFQSTASNAVCTTGMCEDTNNQTDIYIRDRWNEVSVLRRASLPHDPLVAQANGSSSAPFISRSGHYIGFSSSATNLRGADTNNTFEDVYVRVNAVQDWADGCVNFEFALAGTRFGDTSGGHANGAALCGTSNSTPDYVYTFIPPCTSTVTIDTMGSEYDTVLSIHSACPTTAANQLACNDDISGLDRDSRVTLNVQAGVVYKIRVAGYGGGGVLPGVSYGPFQLNISACPPPCPCDWNANGEINSQDLFDFIATFFALNADFNNSGETNSQDFFDFITCFFTGC